jgi:hypothetical protein
VPLSGGQLHIGLLNGALDFLFGACRAFETPNQLFFIAFAVGKIIVGKFAINLLELSLDNVPVTLDLQFCSYPSLAKRPRAGCVSLEIIR